MYRIVEKEGCRSSCVVQSAESVASFMLGRCLTNYIVIKNDTTVVHFHGADYNSMANACAATVPYKENPIMTATGDAFHAAVNNELDRMIEEL